MMPLMTARDFALPMTMMPVKAIPADLATTASNIRVRSLVGIVSVEKKFHLNIGTKNGQNCHCRTSSCPYFEMISQFSG